VIGCGLSKPHGTSELFIVAKGITTSQEITGLTALPSDPRDFERYLHGLEVFISVSLTGQNTFQPCFLELKNVIFLSSFTLVCMD